MYSIGDMVKAFSLSRSTLLYYDKIGLLTPSARTPANYRQYTQDDFHRMTQIATYKEAGLDLAAIADILRSAPNGEQYPIQASQPAQYAGKHTNQPMSQRIVFQCNSLG